MTWRDRLQPASFRGVAFNVDETESTHGRRLAVHQFAQRDIPRSEDMGRRAREFVITGHLIGDDYDIQRDRLLAACEEKGPGLLVHPYRGEMMVVCGPVTVRETVGEGRMCRFSMPFTEAGADTYPSEIDDSRAAARAAADDVAEAAMVGFVEAFLATGFPEFVRAAAESRVAAISEFLSSPGYPIAADLQAASDFVRSVEALAADAAALVLEPGGLAARVLDLVKQVRGAFGGGAFSVLGGLVAQFQSEYSGSTATQSRQRIGANYDAIGEIVRQVAISEQSFDAVDTAHKSYQDAIEVRDAVLDVIDAESERTQNDQVYNALSQLRAEVAMGVPDRSERLPQLLNYVPPVTLPALLIAHSLYGDASREAEIISRNSPRHPGFVTGGQSLEVLSDG